MPLSMELDRAETSFKIMRISLCIWFMEWAVGESLTASTHTITYNIDESEIV